MLARGRYAEAEPLHREALGIRVKKLAAGHIDTLIVQVRLGRTLVKLNMLDESQRLLESAYDQLAASRSPGDAHLRDALTGLVELNEARHAAAPDQQYDVKAEKFRSLLNTAAAGMLNKTDSD